MERARSARASINEVWNALRADQPFSAWVETPDTNVREIWCAFQPAQDDQHSADSLMSTFLVETKSALDACVLATATMVCNQIGSVSPEFHRMPITETPEEFESVRAEGHLGGLRPDQVRAIRLLQPFKTRLKGADPARAIARNMAHLLSGLSALDSRFATGSRAPLVTAWASQADPQPDLPDEQIESAVTDSAGPLWRPKRLATFTLAPEAAHQTIHGDPGVSFDLIMNTMPWPDDPDDNFATRSLGILAIVSHLIDGLERSVREPYRSDALRALHDRMPATPANTWLRVQFGSRTQERDTKRIIAASDRQIATFLNDDGTLVYLRLSANGHVLGREIAPARELIDASQDGLAVEEATRAAAGRWGLPDLVLRPRVFRKGSGVREIGDGTILAGSKGISLQVKTRNAINDSAEKATKWILKNAETGLRQARGTIRTALLDPTVELTNLRGRDVVIRGCSVDWIPVVVIDHPNPPPTGIVPAVDPRGRSVVLMRRDWEFLWDQLRSATAVVDYIHRVAEEPEPVELGSESNRYLDLAEKDAQADAQPVPSWLSEADAENINLPRLPYDPAASPDRFGHAVFQRLLEDVARTDFTGDESERIRLLSQMDRVAVGTRAELGRLLLRRLVDCADAAPAGLRMDHRIMYIDQGSFQIAFSTMSQLTDYHLEMYQSWLLLRRQQYLDRSGAVGPVYPWTVGVLLTPRSDGPRPWDTSVISTNGPPEYDADEYARLVERFDPARTDPSVS